MNDTMDEGVRNGVVAAPTAPIAASFGQFLMQALTDTNIPADKLQIILQARKDMLQSEAKEAFQIAFAEFARELPQVDRDGMVDLGPGKGRYPFTTIEAMDVVIRPLLSKHSLALWYSSAEAPDRESVVVTGHLEGYGWERTSTRRHPADKGPGRNEQQALGSASRYAKRYVTDDLCNIVRKGKDNDGRGAIENVIDATQIGELAALLKTTKTEEKPFLEMMVTGVESLEQIRVRDFPRLVLALKQKQQRQGAQK